MPELEEQMAYVQSDHIMKCIAHRDRAVRLFQHYMSHTWEHVGLRVDSDNMAEWQDIVDNIIDAAYHKMEANQ